MSNLFIFDCICVCAVCGSFFLVLNFSCGERGYFLSRIGLADLLWNFVRVKPLALISFCYVVLQVFGRSTKFDSPKQNQHRSPHPTKHRWRPGTCCGGFGTHASVGVSASELVVVEGLHLFGHLFCSGTASTLLYAHEEILNASCVFFSTIFGCTCIAAQTSYAHRMSSNETFFVSWVSMLSRNDP